MLGITQEGKWVYRLQPALNQPMELFRWSCEQVADAIDEVSAEPAGRVGGRPSDATGTRLVGYADRLSARPGERLRVMVSARRRAAARLVALPGGEPVDGAGRARWRRSRRSRCGTGSHVGVAHDPALRPADGLVVSTWVWLAPGAPAAGGAR